MNDFQCALTVVLVACAVMVGALAELHRHKRPVQSVGKLEEPALPPEPQLKASDVCILGPWKETLDVALFPVIAKLWLKDGWEIETTGGTNVSHVRSQLASTALLRRKETWFVWCDNDNAHLASWIHRLVLDAQAGDLDILAAVVPCRSPRAHMNFAPLDQVVVGFGVGGSIVEADYVGLALAVMHRRVLERIVAAGELPRVGYTNLQGKKEPGYPFFASMLKPGKDGELGEDPGEDVAFCRRARATGSRIWVDTRMVASHRASRWLTARDIHEALEADAVEQLVKETVED